MYGHAQDIPQQRPQNLKVPTEDGLGGLWYATDRKVYEGTRTRYELLHYL